MEKLKIGLFVDSWYPMVDGVVMVVDNYAKRLSALGHDVTVFTLSPKGECDKTFPYKVVQCKTVKVKFAYYDLPNPQADKEFKKELEQSNLDIVHIHSPFGVGKIGVKYAKEHNIPAIATMHSQYKKDFYKATKNKLLTSMLLKGIMKVFNSCDEYYAVNSRMSEVFHEYGANHKPLVQRNGTDLTPVEDPQKADDLVNSTYNIDPSTPVFLFVGRLTLLKNIIFIVESLALLKDKNFKMFFVGTGSDEDELKACINEHNLQDNIILTGRISDRELIKSIYHRAKLFLFPSLYDASSLVQIEAASQGTPTLFLEGAATSATVTNNVNGFICEPTQQAFANKITEALENTELYNKVQNGAINDLFITWDDCVKEILEKYETALNNKKQPN